MYRKALLLVLCMMMVLPLSVSAQDATPITTEPVQQAQVNYENILFRFDTSLASGVNAIHYAATGNDVMSPAPAYTQFSLGFYTQSNFAAPQINVFNIADFGAYPYFTEQFNILSNLLATHADLNAYVSADSSGMVTLPMLPMYNATQVMRTAPQYIEVDGLRGIRYLTFYAQDVSPIIEGQIFYTFQGITEDGQHYVSARFPINTGLLPAEYPQIDDYEAWSQNYATYLDDLHSSLIIAGDILTPAMRQLDAIVESIQVN